MLSAQQSENYILQLLRQQDSQNNTIAQLGATISQLQSQVAALTTIGAETGGGASTASAIDSYLTGGGIVHKLVHTFLSAINVIGLATFKLVVIDTGLTFSGLTASLPLQLSASRVVISALINLTSAITGILPRANGGLANGVVTAYAGTISGTGATGTCAIPTTGIAASGTYAVVMGNVVIPDVTGPINGTTSAVAVSGTSSTNI